MRSDKWVLSVVWRASPPKCVLQKIFSNLVMSDICDPDFPIPLCGGHSCMEVAVQNMPVAQYHWSERALGQNCMTQDKNNSWWLTCTEGRTYFTDAYEGFLARPNTEIFVVTKASVFLILTDMDNLPQENSAWFKRL